MNSIVEEQQQQKMRCLKTLSNKLQFRHTSCRQLQMVNSYHTNEREFSNNWHKITRRSANPKKIYSAYFKTVLHTSHQTWVNVLASCLHKLKPADNYFVVQTFYTSLSDHQRLNQNPFHQWGGASYFSYPCLSMDAEENDVSVTSALSPDLSLLWYWDPWHHLPTEWM